MDPKITKIENLTKKTELDNAQAITFKLSASNDIATGEGLDAALVSNFALPTDNIQVTWTEDKNDHRSVGGKFAFSGTKASITGLLDVSKYSVGLTGELEIGAAPSIAKLNVSIGNLNKAGDWIIDFSDQRDGKSPSEIDVQALIDWVKSKNAVTTDGAALTDVSDEKGAPVDVKKFIIEFKQFYFNITQKTFDFWVQSKEGQTLQFGEFIIKNVGARITNVPLPVIPGLEVTDKEKAD